MNVITRRAWLVLTGLSGLIAVLALGDMFAGVEFEPTGAVSLTGRTLAELRAESPDSYRVLDGTFRSGGVTLVFLGIVLAVVSAIPYRAGASWAWVTAWALPGWFVGVLALQLALGTAPGRSLSAPALSGGAFAVVTAVILLADSRRFRRAS